MLVAVNCASNKFFEGDRPYSGRELFKFVRRASSLGFKGVQIGPLTDFIPIEGAQLKKLLDDLRVERNVHVGGVYDAEWFVSMREEYIKAQEDMHDGIMLCRELSSALVSVHPPFFAAGSTVSEQLRSRAKMRFHELLEEEIVVASQNQIKIAVESFCYDPFIFGGLNDFVEFISKFPREKLGILLDLGHVYQMGIDLCETVHKFEGRLLDVHVHDATLDSNYRKATHLPIGKGTINFQDFIGLLREVGYDGWLTLEIRGSEEEILQGKEYLDSLI
jgi:sugar phosphate isomerase/epimerase